MKYIFLLMLFSTLIFANDSMLETCKKLVKTDNTNNTNNEMLKSCNKLLKKENKRLENIKKFRIRTQFTVLYGNLLSDESDTALNISFQYAFYKNVSVGVSIGQLQHTCEKTLFIFRSDEDKTCEDGDIDYKRAYGDIYLSINFLDDYRHIRTGFTTGIGIVPEGDNEYRNKSKDDYEALLFINFFFGFKIANMIDLTASIGLGKIFSLEAGINF